ncbi:Adenylate cyclase type IX [Fasciola hepatica]|uniref:adenylate cyclase n=1 Tax=Fasciola hepatica TaxID=6192 RepID=A0A4E0RFU7_FASHE|nr:Adenylate cyclase type IX [Fasciola hepatica]
MSLDDKQASLKPIGRSSDVQMLEALKDLARMEDVFAFPPISRFTLSFHSRPVELSYRNLGLRRPKGLAAKNLSWSTPRVAPFINAVVETIILILILVTCLATFPDSLRAAHSPMFYVVAVIALFLQFLFLSLLIVDMIAWNSGQAGSGASRTTGCNWRRCAMRTYMVCFRWPMRNTIGAILLFLPSAVVLSNFTGAYFTGTREYSHIFVAYYRIIFGLMFAFMLFNYTLFTTFSSWTKTLSACVGCTIAIVLCLLPAKTYSSLHLAYDRYWQFEPIVHKYNQAGVALPAWVVPVMEDSFRWELLVVLSVTMGLIGALNRECDISFRLSFHRDYEALRAKQAIAHQKIQADWLLENIIPYYIMDDLRLHSKYSRHIDDAAVVFACISNFAEFYDEQYQGGQEMLRVLNEIFADFEHQLASVQYKDVEKIKSNGACFMVASGLNMTERRRNRRPDTHLHALMDFALDLIHTLDDFNRQMFNFQFEMKVGYNIGEVTAGVIGTTKLLYDIWGDTVNVASRMYSTGQKGRIQVTEAVAKRLESRYVFEYRGEVFVKGKGDMKTYLLSHRRND